MNIVLHWGSRFSADSCIKNPVAKPQLTVVCNWIVEFRTVDLCGPTGLAGIDLVLDCLINY